MRIIDVGSMFDELEGAMQRADEAVQPWQTVAKPGDYYVRVDRDLGITIYGELLDPTVPADTDHAYDAGDLEEIREEAKIYDEPHMKHYRWGRHFSVACEDGELGDVHVSTIDTFLTKALFEAARAARWPEDPRTLGVDFKVDARDEGW